MRDRIPALEGDAKQASGAAPGSTGSAINDATSALIALGFRSADASRAVRAVPDAQSESSENLIRLALKALSA